MGANLLRFIHLDGAGVGLLFRYAHDGEHVENRFTLYFQLPGQVIDSNLLHPPSIASVNMPLSLHVNLTVFSAERLAASRTTKLIRRPCYPWVRRARRRPPRIRPEWRARPRRSRLRRRRLPARRTRQQ